MHSISTFTVSRERQKPGFEHGEANLHTKHKKRGDQRPHGIYRIDDVVAFKLRICRKGLQSEQSGIQERENHQQQRNRRELTRQDKSGISAPLGVAHPCAQAG